MLHTQQICHVCVPSMCVCVCVRALACQPWIILLSPSYVYCVDNC